MNRSSLAAASIALNASLVLLLIVAYASTSSSSSRVASTIRAQRPSISRVRTPMGMQRSSQCTRSTRVRDAIYGTHQDQPDGLETVKLTHPSGAEATIYKFGAAATSYKDPQGVEWLAVRPDAKFDGTKAISGGIPHCFPQFGPGALPQHGFARDSYWDVISAGESTATFQLTDSEKTREIWPYPFKALYTVTVTEEGLKTKLVIQNTGEKPFEFTGALHSYFDISNIDDISIVGPFKGKEILDRMQNPAATIVADSDAINISTETDQVVEGVVGTVKINDKGKGKSLLVSSKQGWADTVLWNPYGNEGMGYKNFVCVEAAAAMKPVSVEPGSSWIADMDLIPSAL